MRSLTLREVKEQFVDIATIFDPTTQTFTLLPIATNSIMS